MILLNPFTGVISGAGININWDTRDNTFSSRSGEYIDFTSTFYGKHFLSDYNFERYTFDIRKFFNIRYSTQLMLLLYRV
jgi:outer membrane protein assembly factor BamA